MTGKSIRIGGASGFWGEADVGLPQFLAEGGLDFVVFDYLAEITMSIMARARAKDPNAGYATDFVTAVLKPNVAEVARQGVRLISNAGGVNPLACATAVEALVAEAGLDLKVAVVTGDDLTARAADFAENREMFSDDPFPDPGSIASINAYLGAFPIARALDDGADIVITGRCVDSAVTLGACIHAFGWGRADWNLLSAGSLAGHLLECGPQATGGNYTDWEDVADTIHEIGYPIAEIVADGTMTITKPRGTGGTVTIGTVGEQMLYEIGDPAAYALPDVTCDFTQVELAQTGQDQVRVTGACGRPAPANYKVSATFQDGWRAGMVWFFVGVDAGRKARAFADAALKRANAKLRALNAPPFEETAVEVIGDASAFGTPNPSTDVAVKIAVKHRDPRAAGLILKESTGLGLSAPPGLSGFSGGRPKPSPVVRLFSFLILKEEVPLQMQIGDAVTELGPEPPGADFTPAAPIIPTPADPGDTPVPLIRLAWLRSGDKGNKANIGILPRDPSYAPHIWAALDEAEIARRFTHYLDGPNPRVERFFLPWHRRHQHPSPRRPRRRRHCVPAQRPAGQDLRPDPADGRDPRTRQHRGGPLNGPLPLPHRHRVRDLCAEPRRHACVDRPARRPERPRGPALGTTSRPVPQAWATDPARTPRPPARPRHAVDGDRQHLGLPQRQSARGKVNPRLDPDRGDRLCPGRALASICVDDSGIMAGAIMGATAYKIIRAEQIALEQKLPFVHLVESAGGDLPGYRVEGFIHGGALFGGMAKLSKAGIPVISILHGSSTAGGAYMPGLSDYVVAVKEKGKAFLAGPPLLKAATGEIATEAELGGAEMHATTSGLVEYLAEDDGEAVLIAREVIDRLGWNARCPRPGPARLQPARLRPRRDRRDRAGRLPHTL